MRLDKFFQVAGLIKRRMLAHETCKRGLAKVNGQTAKPTKELKEGDLIELDLPRRYIKLEILKEISSTSLPKNRRSDYFIVLEDLPKHPTSDDIWDDE